MTSDLVRADDAVAVLTANLKAADANVAEHAHVADERAALAAEAEAIDASASIAEAAEARGRKLATRAQSDAANRLLGVARRARDEAARALAGAQQAAEAVRTQLRRAECDRIADRILQRERENRRDAALLATASIRFRSGTLSQHAECVLGEPRIQPTLDMFMGSFVTGSVADLNEPLNGHPAELAAANETWLQFEAALTADSSTEATAA